MKAQASAKTTKGWMPLPAIRQLSTSSRTKRGPRTSHSLAEAKRSSVLRYLRRLARCSPEVYYSSVWDIFSSYRNSGEAR